MKEIKTITTLKKRLKEDYGVEVFDSWIDNREYLGAYRIVISSEHKDKFTNVLDIKKMRQTFNINAVFEDTELETIVVQNNSWTEVYNQFEKPRKIIKSDQIPFGSCQCCDEKECTEYIFGSMVVRMCNDCVRYFKERF